MKIQTTSSPNLLPSEQVMDKLQFVKSVQIRSFFWYAFSLRISPYLDTFHAVLNN